MSAARSQDPAFGELDSTAGARAAPEDQFHPRPEPPAAAEVPGAGDAATRDPALWRRRSRR
jgi:hypothetical protein